MLEWQQTTWLVNINKESNFTDLSPEERKQAAISAALETTFAATPVAAAKLMKAPAKTALIDALTVTGAPSSMADDIRSY